MTEQTEDPQTNAEPAPGARPVEYMGRTFNSVLPTPEQILVWKRTMERLGGATEEEMLKWTGEQTLAALDRIRKIIDSVVSQADVEWLDDQMLQLDPATGESRFTFRHAHGLLLTIVQEFQINNREDRRAAKAAAEPAPRARRKAPAKKTAAKAAVPRGRAR